MKWTLAPQNDSLDDGPADVATDAALRLLLLRGRTDGQYGQ
jgi:hypothetical protein